MYSCWHSYRHHLLFFCTLNSFFITIKYIFNRNFHSISNSTINSFFLTHTLMLWRGRERNFLNINKQQNGTCPCQRSSIPSWQNTSFRYPRQKRSKLTICSGRYHKHDWRHYDSFRETSINFNFFFFHRLVFFVTSLCCTVLELSVLILNIADFFTLFVRKCLHILIKQRKQ